MHMHMHIHAHKLTLLGNSMDMCMAIGVYWWTTIHAPNATSLLPNQILMKMKQLCFCEVVFIFTYCAQRISKSYTNGDGILSQFYISLLGMKTL